MEIIFSNKILTATYLKHIHVNLLYSKGLSVFPYATVGYKGQLRRVKNCLIVIKLCIMNPVTVMFNFEKNSNSLIVYLI